MGTRNSGHSAGSQAALARFISEVREAVVASVTNCPVSRSSRKASVVPSRRRPPPRVPAAAPAPPAGGGAAGGGAPGAPARGPRRDGGVVPQQPAELGGREVAVQ